MASTIKRILSLVSFVFLACVFLQLSSHKVFLVEGEVHSRDGSRRLLQAKIDCGALCETRCSLHSRHNTCARACGTCCQRCNCVPPGTFGNREVCGNCYANMTTHDNELKCP